MNYTFDRADYHKMGPGGAEDEIGGSILSELLEGDHFLGMPDDHDFTYYLSRERFGLDHDEPVSVVSTYKEGLPDQRLFTLDYQKFTQDIENETSTGTPVEDWVEHK